MESDTRVHIHARTQAQTHTHTWFVSTQASRSSRLFFPEFSSISISSVVIPVFIFSVSYPQVSTALWCFAWIVGFTSGYYEIDDNDRRLYSFIYYNVLVLLNI